MILQLNKKKYDREQYCYWKIENWKFDHIIPIIENDWWHLKLPCDLTQKVRVLKLKHFFTLPDTNMQLCKIMSAFIWFSGKYKFVFF